MRRFSYWMNAPFVISCVAYAINRWLVKPHIGSGFMHSHFNDLWLIPCALPPILWLHRWLGLRSHDEVPQWSEILTHLVYLSVLLEWIGPHFVPKSVGDPLDAVANAEGAIGSGLW